MLGGIPAESYDDVVQRMLMFTLRPAVLGDDTPMHKVAKRYKQLVEQLEALSFSSIAIKFSDEAQVIRREMERKHLNFTKLTELNRKLLEHVGKYKGYFARLCLLFHCIECVSVAGKLSEFIITADTAQRVARFLHEFIKLHAISFYVDTLGLADDHDRLQAIAGYILAHKLERITNKRRSTPLTS